MSLVSWQQNSTPSLVSYFVFIWNHASLRLQTPHFEFSKVLPVLSKSSLNKNRTHTKSKPFPKSIPAFLFQTLDPTNHPTFQDFCLSHPGSHHQASSRKVIFQHDNFPAVTSVGKPSTNERSILIGPGVTTKSNLGGLRNPMIMRVIKCTYYIYSPCQIQYHIRIISQKLTKTSKKKNGIRTNQSADSLIPWWP